MLAFASGSGTRYYEATGPDIQLLLALITDVVAVGVILFFCFRQMSSGSRIVRIASKAVVVFLAIFALWQLETAALLLVLKIGTRTSIRAAVTLMPWVLLLGFWIRWRVQAQRAVRFFFLIFSPLFFVLAVNGTWQYTTTAKSIVRGNGAGMLPVKQSQSRVIWVIFDEFDYRLLTGARAHRLVLPEFDRLAAESMSGTHVKAPGHETLSSIPSLLTGRIVEEEQPRPADLRIQFRGSDGWENFRSYPNLFTKTRAAGFNAGISGWFHPYCRVLGSEVSDCAWDNGGFPFLYVQHHLKDKPFYEQAAYLLAWQAKAVPFVLESMTSPDPAPDEGRVERDKGISTLRNVLDGGLRMLRNRDLNLVYIHLPIPHPPGLWDVAAERFTDGPSDYVDNLKLADLTFGRIRRTLEETGDWDSSAVLVSSDHPYRPELWSDSPYWTEEIAGLTRSQWQPLIPFFLKMPKQRQGVTYDREFNSVVSADLLFQLLQGNLRSADDVAHWLDQKK